MTKLCPRGKAAAKRKFKVYPSAYANAYASKICAGKVKDPSGTKRKDWGPKKTNKGAMMKLKKKPQGAILGTLALGAIGAMGVKKLMKKKKGTVTSKTPAGQINPVTGEGMATQKQLSPEEIKNKVLQNNKFGLKKGGVKVKKAGLGLMMAMGKKNRRKIGKQMKRSKLNILSPTLYGMTQLSDGGMPKNTGSYIKQDIEGESFTNESAQAYYKDLLD